MYSHIICTQNLQFKGTFLLIVYILKKLLESNFFLQHTNKCYFFWFYWFRNYHTWIFFVVFSYVSLWYLHNSIHRILNVITLEMHFTFNVLSVSSFKKAASFICWVIHWRLQVLIIYHGMFLYHGILLFCMGHALINWVHLELSPFR